MKVEGRGKEFPIAQKIYGALLRAYPAAHRAAYGGAMAQLFRDQCRDAWGESKNFGLLKLWLRVLPDLVSTSIMERLAALNERKTMNEKLASVSSFQTPPAKIFFRVFAVVFLLVFLYGVAAAFLLPDSYASTATMKVENDQGTTPNPNYDPYFIQTQFEIIKSDLVLSNVIAELDLNQIWGKKYFKGETLKSSETLEILKGRLSLAPVGNTKLMTVTVYSDDKNEAAQIANAIAKSYQAFRVRVRVEAAKSGIAPVRLEYEAESQKIELAMTRLEDLRKKSEETNTDALAAYTDAKAKMQRMTDSHKLSYSKLKALEIDAAIPITTMVQITEPAEPGKAPVKPNKTLNIVGGAFFGILLAGAIGGVAFFITKLRQRNRAPDALVGS